LAGFKSISRLAGGYADIRRTLARAITPFGRTSAADQRERRERACRELKFFAETYFPHYLTDKPSKMHRHFYRRFQQAVDRARAPKRSGKGSFPTRIAQAAPRGHAKSTITSLILPLWCIAAEKRKFIGLVSDTTEQAAEFLEFIKAELEVNERLLEDFPKACGEGRTWKTGHILTANGVKLKCWGKRKAMRGARHGHRRPDLVICDDLESDEHIDAPEQRAKDREWFFKALMKIGGRYTVFVVVGTLLHYDSLLAHLLKRPGWQADTWRAVVQWSASPLWEQWEHLFAARKEKEADQFFRRHKKTMLAGTEVLWPKVEDYYYLMKMRVSDGPAYFDSEKQNQPINPEDCLFQESWLRFVEEDEIQRKLAGGGYKEFYGAVDPSLGKQSQKADPSAIVIAGVDADGFIDVLEADIQKRHPDAIMEDVFAYHQRYGLAVLGIEEVQFQELFKDLVIKESARRRVYLPVEGLRPNTDKVLRITKIQPQIKNGVIRFRRHQTILLDQLRYFPKADHDDGPDALEMTFTLITQAHHAGPRVRLL